MYAVMGITGNVGGAIARSLLARGEKVRGIVRNPEKAAEWQKQGVELFKADYDDAEALTAAFSGVDGVFVMVPPNFAPAAGYVETKATLEVLHKALSKARPPKAVYLSSIGAEQTSPDWVSSPARIFSNRRWAICRSRTHFFAQVGFSRTRRVTSRAHVTKAGFNSSSIPWIGSSTWWRLPTSARPARKH